MASWLKKMILDHCPIYVALERLQDNMLAANTSLAYFLQEELEFHQPTKLLAILYMGFYWPF